ncbi:stemmadenine O-acetyltransferase-like [Cornus florida]|uniref:stemmadenine O-acetyltransferase-like n=1 Tax=Cornus florida TaxID=4283 RepID=UPI0028990354|nr:stemmadenine O-acetyltransferase-like [Cornus florida]
MVKIDIISKELIKPSSPTPHHLRTYHLSLLDQLTAILFFPLILYYSNDETGDHTQSNMSHCLKTSLSNALTRFYPLAGRIKDERSVDCNDEGVDYLEARVYAKLSDIIELPEAEVLNQLVPYTKNGSVVIRDVQLGVQVNLLDCGSIAIGVCISHRIADGHSFVMFINTWAAMARGERDLVHPNLNNASLFPPLDLPKPTNSSQERVLVTKRFVFNSSAIAALKARAVTGASCTVQQPTRVEVVTALIWKCAMAQRDLDRCSTSIAAHQVNLRGRMVTPMAENHFGNLIRTAFATSTDGEEELASLVHKLREGMKKIDIDYIRKLSEDGYAVIKNSSLKKLVERLSGSVQLLSFSSWCRFPIYEADFGWGKPTWVSIAGIAIKDTMFLMDSKNGDGIEAWVVLDEQDMAKFEQHSDLLSYVSSN